MHFNNPEGNDFFNYEYKSYIFFAMIIHHLPYSVPIKLHLINRYFPVCETYIHASLKYVLYFLLTSVMNVILCHLCILSFYYSSPNTADVPHVTISVTMFPMSSLMLVGTVLNLVMFTVTASSDSHWVRGRDRVANPFE